MMAVNAAAANSYDTTITSLNDNDVLCGRGTGPNKFIGNKRFRQYVKTRKQEYSSSGPFAFQDKTQIAQQVVDHVHGLGGRFVRQLKKGRREGDLLVDGVWREESRDVALEKAKQTLRDKYVPKQEGETTLEGSTSTDLRGSLSSIPLSKDTGLEGRTAPAVGELSPSDGEMCPNTKPTFVTPSNMLPSTFSPVYLGNLQQNAVDARLFLFQRGLALPPLQPPA